MMNATTTPIDVRKFLNNNGLHLTPQRIAVAGIILRAMDHPSAKTVLKRVRNELHSVSTATVYNTLHLLVEHGLIQEVYADGGSVLYDPDLSPHHHFVDEASGRVYDIPWDDVQIPPFQLPEQYQVRNFSVTFRGTATGSSPDTMNTDAE